MNVLILGGTGFIGSALSKKLLAENYQVSVSTRQNRLYGKMVGQIKHLAWDGHSASQLEDIAFDADVIINLVGENLSEGRWTEQRKEQILSSRIDATKALTEALPKLPQIKILLQASAVGYYGYWEEEKDTPTVIESGELGTDFLAQTCQKWEEFVKTLPSMQAPEFRYCIMRFAPVLGNGGMLKKLLPPFKMLAGGIPGHGRQPISWIHIDDLAKAAVFLIKSQKAHGIYNFAAPDSCSMEKFIVTMANIIKKPYAFPLPSALLRLLYGEMAKSIILGGQKAYPKALLDLGFEFDFPNINLALTDIFEQSMDL